MLIISLLAVVGTLCWLVFTFAVYAVPAFVGLSIAAFAHQTGSGTFGSAVVGLAAAALTLVAFQRLFAVAHSVIVRRALAIGFAGPPAYAGYHAALGIAELATESEAWAQMLGLLGALFVGLTAWTRLTRLAPSAVTGGGSRGTVAEV